MIEKITRGSLDLAIIIRSSFQKEGIHFFTPESYTQQLAYMNRPSGYVIQPHLHNPVERDVQYTKEVIFVKSEKSVSIFMMRIKITLKALFSNKAMSFCLHTEDTDLK